jgi:dTDP-4-amino-4,6-dideoxygalactose transaminase
LPTAKTIAPLDLAAERAFLGPALEDALRRVLASGQFVLGPEVERIERSMAELSRARHGIGVGSGTDALALGLLALGVERGDEVVTSPFTFFASAGAIAWIGAVPRLADVEETTGLLDVDAAERALSSRTRCILPVHLYGQMVDMRAFRALADARGLALLEDAAQSHGAARDGVACGEFGDACAYSFYPTKNLGAAGEGGLIVTSRADVAERARRLRDHGSAEKYRHALIGTNSRLQAFQGAVLNVKLPHLQAWNRRRAELARRYDEAFAELPGVRPLARAPDSTHVYHQYTVRVTGRPGRDVLQAGLKERGILAAVHYPLPVHLQEAAQGFGYRAGDFPVAERLAREVLCLPIHPFLSADDHERVIAGVRELVARG